MRKAVYEKPKMEISCFSIADIVRTSREVEVTENIQFDGYTFSRGWN